MPDPVSAIGGFALGLAGTIGKMIGRGKANKQLDELLKKDPTYAANPEVANRLGLAKTLLNARMPGAASVERNIYGNQANTNAAVSRNATDSSQALAIAAGVGGQTNQAFEQQGLNDANDYQRRLNNVTGAQEATVNEGDKVYNDQLRRYGDEVQVRGQQNQNRQDNWSDLSNLGFSISDFGMSGGFSKMFGGAGGAGGLNPAQGNGTYGSNFSIPGISNRRTPNF